MKVPLVENPELARLPSRKPAVGSTAAHTSCTVKQSASLFFCLSDSISCVCFFVFFSAVTSLPTQGDVCPQEWLRRSTRKFDQLCFSPRYNSRSWQITNQSKFCCYTLESIRKSATRVFLYYPAVGAACKAILWLNQSSLKKRDFFRALDSYQKGPWFFFFFLRARRPIAPQRHRERQTDRERERERERESRLLLQPPRKTVWRCLKSHTASEPSKQGRLYRGQDDKTRQREAKSG